jgi:hypothetical protein
MGIIVLIVGASLLAAVFFSQRAEHQLGPRFRDKRYAGWVHFALPDWGMSNIIVL